MMTINLTQEFVFETDDLDSLEQMLDVVVRIMFQKGRYQKSEHRMRLQITGDTIPETPICFRDGKYDTSPAWPMCRPLLLPMSEVDPQNKLFALVEHGETFGGCCQLKVVEGAGLFEDRHDAARASSSKEEEPKPTRQWITSIWDCDHENTHLKKNEVFVARGYADLVREIIKVCKRANQKKFLEEFCEVAPDTDGSVDVGFRLESRCRMLDLSLVHIIYGK